MNEVVSPDIMQNVLFVVVSTLGVTETLKRMFGDKCPKIAKPFITAIVSMGSAWLFFANGSDVTWIELGVLGWSITQIAYDLLLKTIINLLDRVAQK